MESPAEFVPPGVRAVLRVLRFDQSPELLPELSAAELGWTDRQHLTPLLSLYPVSASNREYIHGAAQRNEIRMQRFRAAYDETAGQFDHVILNDDAARAAGELYATMRSEISRREGGPTAPA